jgi:V8-like Glu-specific endopeptidase
MGIIRWLSSKATIAILVVTLLLVIGQAHAGVWTTWAVDNPWDYPNRQQCMVIAYRRDSSGVEQAWTIGSGTVIGRRSVLTAAHVVHGASRVEVIPGFSAPAGRPFGTFYASRVDVRGGFINASLTPGKDCAVITTSQEIGTVLGGWLRCSGYNGGEDCTAIGYPIDQANAPYGNCWWKYRQVAERGRVNVSPWPDTFRLDLDFSVNHGLSGAGILNRSNEVVGMVQSLLWGIMPKGLRMNQMLDWINSVVNSTPRTSARTIMEGRLVRQGSRPEVYVIVGGARLHVPSAEEFVSLGYGWDWIEGGPGGSLDAVPRVPCDGTVFRERSYAEVYVMLHGRRHWIRNEGVLNRYGGWGAVRLVPNLSTWHIPFGGSIFY